MHKSYENTSNVLIYCGPFRLNVTITMVRFKHSSWYLFSVCSVCSLFSFSSFGLSTFYDSTIPPLLLTSSNSVFLFLVFAFWFIVLSLPQITFKWDYTYPQVVRALWLYFHFFPPSLCAMIIHVTFQNLQTPVVHCYYFYESVVF